MSKIKVKVLHPLHLVSDMYYLYRRAIARLKFVSVYTCQLQSNGKLESSALKYTGGHSCVWVIIMSEFIFNIMQPEF